MIYFFGCDMGGWHNTSLTKGDALAVCRWNQGALEHVGETAALTFFPVEPEQGLARCLDKCLENGYEVIVCIDAALSWPSRFAELTREAQSFEHNFDFDLTDSINNPYLYRETERFIKRRVQTGSNERPLTAVGDKFGNNSSKAQALAGWLFGRMDKPYRPPFDAWHIDRARAAKHTIIEVYPAASMKSAKFRKLEWPTSSQRMEDMDNSDIADAKRCAMAGFVYAASIGKIRAENCPAILTPDDIEDDEFSKSALRIEGWIFAPKCE